MNEFKIDTLHCCLNQRWNNSFGITGEVNVPFIKVLCFQQVGAALLLQEWTIQLTILGDFRKLYRKGASISDWNSYLTQWYLSSYTTQVSQLTLQHHLNLHLHVLVISTVVFFTRYPHTRHKFLQLFLSERGTFFVLYRREHCLFNVPGIPNVLFALQ